MHGRTSTLCRRISHQIANPVVYRARTEADHFAAGHHHCGIFKLLKGYSTGVYLAELQLIWDASEAEEWVDQSCWIPL